MITTTQLADTNILDITLSGIISREDYETVLIPAIDHALEEHDGIRALVRIDDGVDYTMGALSEDTRMGLKHWRGFERLAILGGAGWVSKMATAVSIMMPCPVMHFQPGEGDDALRWLQESLGSIHQIDLGGGVLHVKLLGKLDPSIYAAETEQLDAFIRDNERMRVLLDLREFDGWQGLAAVAEHLKLIRDHHARIDKLAIVGQQGWEKMAARIGRSILGASLEYFRDDPEGAEAWLRS
ncbi:MAG: STAS/SEC14 domain-containing protein [Pseudomonadota bacterium]